MAVAPAAAELGLSCRELSLGSCSSMIPWPDAFATLLMQKRFLMVQPQLQDPVKPVSFSRNLTAM